MKDFLVCINDFLANVDPISFAFGCFMCYLCELLFIPIYRLQDGILNRLFKKHNKGV